MFLSCRARDRWYVIVGRTVAFIGGWVGCLERFQEGRKYFLMATPHMGTSYRLLQSLGRELIHQSFIGEGVIEFFHLIANFFVIILQIER